MARSPLTLAATVTAALPGVGVVGTARLTENAAGRYDSAVVTLDDGRLAVVRVPNDSGAARELEAEVRALRALTPGVRAILPFRVPMVWGETGFGDAVAVVVDYLPGYRVDAAELPSGPGVATRIGSALAAVHALPTAVLRDDGLPAMTAQQQRDDVSRLLDRVSGTDAVSPALLRRWARAVRLDALWQFESTVILGGASADSFLFEDDPAGPRVAAVTAWHALCVGDPAIDLRWLASAPAAADDVYISYAAGAQRAPDAGLRARARLYAELEFARWLLHGIDEGRDDIVGDAVTLLASLADGVRDDDVFRQDELDVDDAIALLGRTPDSHAPDVDTSMQTDAYDPGALSMFVSEDDTDADAGDVDDAATAPIDISAWSERRADDPTDDDGSDRPARAASNR